MKFFKKFALIITACAAMCLCLGFSACGGAFDAEQSDTSDTEQSGTSDTEQSGGSSDNEQSTSDLTFTLLDDDTYSVKASSTSISGALTIPSTYNGKAVTKIADEAFQSCTKLESVTISDNVTSIGKDAFEYCTSLTGVYITDLEAWFNISFGNISANPVHCSHNLYLNGTLVTTLKIPDSVTSIGNYAFQNCNSLTSITIPDSVTNIGKYAFAFCTSLTSVTIGSGVTSIGNYAFYGCTKLTDVYYNGTSEQWANVNLGSSWKPSAATVTCLGDGS